MYLSAQMVQSVPKISFFRASGYLRCLDSGRKYHHSGGQFAIRNDSAILCFRYHRGSRRLLFSTADRHLSAPVADGHLFPDLISDTAVAAFYAESRLDPGMARFYPCHRRDPCGADLSASDPGICHRWSAARGSQHPQHADDTAQCHRRYRAWRILGQIRLVQQRDDALYGVRHDRQLLDDELGYALKFMRVLLLILTFFLNLWGFIAGTLIAVGCLVFNRTIAGKSYIYPLIPFHWSELKKRLLRNRLPHEEKNG